LSELQKYIDENIPLAGKARLSIDSSHPDRVLVSGPFEENRNPHGSVFGGSISVISVLAGWLLVREVMEREKPGAHIVISRQSLDYLRPVRGNFVAEATLPDSELYSSFVKWLKERGKARLEIPVVVREAGKEEPCARFRGTFHVRAE